MVIGVSSDSIVETISEKETSIGPEVWRLTISLKTEGSNGVIRWESIALYHQVHVRNPNESGEVNRQNYCKIDNENASIYTDDKGLHIKGHSEKPNGLATYKEYFYAKDHYKYFSKSYERIS